ncbi:MAG TPA: hypothetical protein VNG71_03930 [Pyrinomonadaceae bacterium]|nr:hypothetical protein [Pyrinomonadaceae bacterium]
MDFQNPQEIEAKVEARHRVFLILWAAIFVSVGLLSTLAVVIGNKGTPNPALSYALLGIGAMMVALSFLLRQKLSQQALDKNDIAALQTAHILSLALSESAALFGLVDRLSTSSSTSWFLFALSAFGILLSFPSKDWIRQVTYKQ